MTASSLVLFYLFIFYFRTNFPNSVKTVKCAVNRSTSLSVSRLFFLHAFRIASRNGLFRIQKKSSISKTRTIPLCVSLPISPQRCLNRCWGCFKKRITCQSNERNKFHWKKRNYFIAMHYGSNYLAQHYRPWNKNTKQNIQHIRMNMRWQTCLVLCDAKTPCQVYNWKCISFFFELIWQFGENNPIYTHCAIAGVDGPTRQCELKFDIAQSQNSK